MRFDNLKKFREDMGMTQKEFAASLNIKYTTYNGYEKGDRDPGGDFWRRVSEKYNISIDYLLGVSDTKKPAASSGDGLGEDVIKLAEKANRLDCDALKILNAHADLLIKHQEAQKD